METIGKFDLYEDRKYGGHIGYIICCGLHRNEGDADNVECRKYLNFGTVSPLSHAECKLRLKRWLLLGFYGATPWPRDRPDTARI